MARARLLVAFVDALGPSQLERFGSLLDLAPSRRHLDGVLGYSSGALATLLTGAPASAHGRMCLFARSAAPRSPLSPLALLGLLPRAVHERGFVRRRLARLVRRWTGNTGYVALHRVPPEVFRWVDLPEREDLFQARAIGGATTFLTRAREAGLRVFASPWQLGEGARWEVSFEALAKDPPDLAFLYSAELDGVLHASGPDSAPAQAARARVAARITRAAELCARGGAEVTTLLVGDHDMAEVRRVVDPRPVLAELDARCFVDSTLLRLWGDAPALDRARAALERARVPGRWLGPAELRARRAPVVGSPYGDAMLVLDEGALFAPSFVGGACRGMHGYDVGAASARAALAASAAVPDEVRSLEDVAPWLCQRLGVA